MSKVSVIVPVYNVEQYIERCARSLFEQSLEDMEFIFVDDCSPDSSMLILSNIIDEYPERKKQIVFHRMPFNSGLAEVRKMGYEIASGEYVIACDSDDYVDLNMYESMYSYAKINNLDLVHCDIEVVDDTDTIKLLTIKGDVSSESLREGIIRGSISNSLCNKLIKRSILLDNHIQYAKSSMDEDNTLAIQFAFYSIQLGYLHAPYYKAYLNKNSISRVEGKQQTIRRFEGALKNSEIIVGFLMSHGYQEDDLAVINAKLRAKMALTPSLNNKGTVRLWRNTYPEVNHQVFSNKNIPKRVKIKCALIMLHLFPLVYGILRKQ